MDKMKPWNKGFYQQRPFNMAQAKDGTQTQVLERPQAPERTQASSDPGGWTHAQPGAGGWIMPLGSLGRPGGQIIPGVDTSLQMEWLSGLPRDERMEAKRLELQSNFSFDGFQVIRHQASPYDPVMTI